MGKSRIRDFLEMDERAVVQRAIDFLNMDEREAVNKFFRLQKQIEKEKREASKRFRLNRSFP